MLEYEQNSTFSTLAQIPDRELHEECGVFGVFGVQNAANLTYYSLHSLQHRGQEGCGIVACNDGVFSNVKGEGLVTEIFNEKNLSSLPLTSLPIQKLKRSSTAAATRSC